MGITEGTPPNLRARRILASIVVLAVIAGMVVLIVFKPPTSSNNGTTASSQSSPSTAASPEAIPSASPLSSPSASPAGSPAASPAAGGAASPKPAGGGGGGANPGGGGGGGGANPGGGGGGGGVTPAAGPLAITSITDLANSGTPGAGGTGSSCDTSDATVNGSPATKYACHFTATFNLNEVADGHASFTYHAEGMVDPFDGSAPKAYKSGELTATPPAGTNVLYVTDTFVIYSTQANGAPNCSPVHLVSDTPNAGIQSNTATFSSKAC